MTYFTRLKKYDRKMQDLIFLWVESHKYELWIDNSQRWHINPLKRIRLGKAVNILERCGLNKETIADVFRHWLDEALPLDSKTCLSLHATWDSVGLVPAVKIGESWGGVAEGMSRPGQLWSIFCTSVIHLCHLRCSGTTWLLGGLWTSLMWCKNSRVSAILFLSLGSK